LPRSIFIQIEKGRNDCLEIVAAFIPDMEINNNSYFSFVFFKGCVLVEVAQIFCVE